MSNSISLLRFFADIKPTRPKAQALCKSALIFGSLSAISPASADETNSWPSWWTHPTYGIFEDAPDAPGEFQNTAAINQGQLKHVAEQAAALLTPALDEFDPSATAEIDALIASFDQQQNAATANAGQLKHVAAPFYRALKILSYDPAADLQARGITPYQQETPPLTMPWDPAAPPAENASTASIGQLKATFAFDLNPTDPADLDADGLPDALERAIITADTTGTDTSLQTVLPEEDPDGDGESNATEAETGTDPVDLGDSTIRLTILTPLR